MKKQAIVDLLLDTFNAHPDESFSVKKIFQMVDAKKHPAKMLVMDALEDLVLDDYINTDGHGNYSAAVRSNVMEGIFPVNATVTTRLNPTTAARASLCVSATRCTLSTATV